MNREQLRGWLALVVVVVLVWLTLLQASPPAWQGKDAPADAFSAERALQHLEVIAAEPHPSGSAAHARVRDYLIGQIEQLGLPAEVQTATGLFPLGRITAHSGGTMQNVLTRIPGTNNTKAVLVTAHYDSVPHSPGASDDGAGVAAMLETMRALQHGPKLQNDVIFFFSDGEEVALVGAAAFWSQHPWVKDVGVVLNFEARGSKGASVLFETSADNGWLIPHYAAEAVRPVASSLLGDLYKRMPNNTDMTVSKEAGISGLNFAYVDGWENYHTMHDSVQRISADSVQHHGENMLRLTARLGGADLRVTTAPDRTFFHAFGQVVHYPMSWVVPLTVIAGLLVLGGLICGLIQKRLRVKGLLLGLLAVLTCLLAAVLLCCGVWSGVQALWAGDMTTPAGATYGGGWYEICFLALTVMVTTLLLGWWRRHVSLPDLVGGVLFWWLALLIALTLKFPGGSYLLTWPLAVGSAVWWLCLFSDQAEEKLKHPLALLVTAIPTVLMIVSITETLYLLMPASLNVYAMALVVLGLAMLAPHLNATHAIGRRFLPTISFLAAFAMLVITGINSHPNASQPLGSHLFYSLNADRGQANWVSFGEPDEWTARYLSDPQADTLDQVLASSLSARDVFKSQAPLWPLAAPQVEIRSDQTVGTERTVHLHIKSARQAHTLLLEVRGTALRSAQIAGQESVMERDRQTKTWSLLYEALPAGGIDLTLRLQAGAQARLLVTDVTSGIPHARLQEPPHRPDNLMSAGLFDLSTLVTKQIDL